MKYDNEHFLQFNRLANDENHMQMSDACYRLYGTLKELEQIFCDKHNNVFYATDKDLAIRLNWSLSKVVRTKKELKQYDDLVEMEAKRYIKYNGIRSADPITFYRLL